MYVHIFPIQNICSLTYFKIKIFVCVNEAESIFHAFLISALYYACNMFEILKPT